MANITLTLLDVEQDGVKMVRLRTDWGTLTDDELVMPTQAMLAAKEFEHLFATGSIDLNQTMARLLAERQEGA